jgi:nitrogen fixation NifU-like protein
MYSKKVMQLFKNPKNVGEIKNADGVGKIRNPVCGDTTEVFIKVKDSRISAIKFKTLGCAAAISSASITTEMAKGRKLSEAEKLTKEKVVKQLGGLPENKIHCSVLAVDALKEAIKDYKKRCLKAK